MTTALLGGGLLFAVAVALGAAFVRSRRGRVLSAAQELAYHRGLKADGVAGSWSGEVKGLPTRVAFEPSLDVSPTGIGVVVTAPNPSAIAFTLRASGLSEQRNFARAAPELIVALDGLKIRTREVLRISAEGEVGFHCDLRFPTIATFDWLQSRLADCQELGRLLPLPRGIRSISRNLRPAQVPPEEDKTDADDTLPFAADKLDPKA